jgi:hypothetical protein
MADTPADTRSARPTTPALWGGRFDKAADLLFREINDSLPFDYLLFKEDIAGSIAWARASPARSFPNAVLLCSDGDGLTKFVQRKVDATCRRLPRLAFNSRPSAHILLPLGEECLRTMGEHTC